MVVFASAGWLLAIGLGVHRLAEPRVAETATPNCVASGQDASHSISAPNTAPPAALMEVYVRPHPPDFKTGRWVRFRRYRSYLAGGIEKVQFLGPETVTVNSEAIEWPKQRRAYE